MRLWGDHARRRRYLVAAVLVVVSAITFVVATAFADAPMTTGTISVSVGPVKLVGGTMVRTLTVNGTWSWPAHNSDCNGDRAGAGYAVDWNDPNQAGNHVTTLNSQSIDVGAAAANAFNPPDDEVHPTPADPGSFALFNDPFYTNVPPTKTDLANNNWKSGCGTFDPVNVFNSGTWGPLSHTYTVAALDQGTTICTLVYDVHPPDAGTANSVGGSIPGDKTEITAGGINHNSDNTAQGNGADDQCVNVTLPGITTVASGPVQLGSSITDVATLHGASGSPAASTITFNVYAAGDASCSSPLNPAPLAATGSYPTYTSAPFTPTHGGSYVWVATFAGDANNIGATTGVCNDTNETSVVTALDANVKVTPATATNAVSTTHTLTITVAGVSGTIDPGTYTATASIFSGPGSFVGSPSCTYTAAAPTCNVVITSALTGTTVVHVATTVSVGGQSITRATSTTANTNAGGSADASKTWVDANIKISPATATNGVGTNHTLTITVAPVGGTIDGGTFTASASIVTGPGGFVGNVNTCTYTAAAPSCTVVISSAATGTTVVHAATTVSVNGQSIARATSTALNTTAGGNNDASKTWVDANIKITPATANKPVGTTHTLTITVAPVNGPIDAGTYTATASITGAGSFVGNVSTCTYTAASPTCTVVITSASGGTSVVHATTTVSVLGQSIVRATSTAVNTTAGGSLDASKTWVDANIQISPATATNAVGSTHTLTITVAPVNGTIDGGTFTATASIFSGPGSFVGSPSCTYTAAAPTCNVVITSTVTGTTVVHATTIVSVAGQSLTRSTSTLVNTNAGGTNDASKTWVDANIKISPATATNGVGTNHTLTITVAPVGGTIDGGTFTASASIVTGPGGFVGNVNTCTYSAAAPSCTVVISSAATGTTVVHAATTVSVNGQSIARATSTALNTTAGGNNDASKTWVDANIKITPATAMNPIGTTHTLTITVAGLNGTIDPGTYTAAASLVSGSVGSFVGGVNTCTYTAASPTCTVVITSATTGTSVVHAATTVSVNGQSIARATSTAVNTTAGGSLDASKLWVDANIQITPATATNAVNTNHTLTISVAGLLDPGTYTATASIFSGPGSFVGSSSCTFTAAAPTCDVVITSTLTGTTVVHATTTVSVGGQTITRATSTLANTTAGGSNDASKTWVDANIKLTPAAATNAVGTTHTLTIAVAPVGGAIDPGTYTATASIFSGPGGFVGGSTCTYTAAAPACTVVITSTATGITVVHAATTVSVNGQSIVRATSTALNTTAGGSLDASKIWVDANIKITPATAANAIGTTHTLTITVAGVNGTVDAGTFTAVASLAPGSVGSFVGGVNTCTYTNLVNACTVVITSPTTGTTVVHAATTVSVNGQSIDRATSTALNTTAGGSLDASKTWVDGNIKITPATATNGVNTNHTLTITVAAVGGTIDAGTYTASASIVTGPGTFVGGNTCTFSGGGPSGTCNVVITSTAVGTTVVHAAIIFNVDGQSISRATSTTANTAAGGSNDASKTWVDGNIKITPAAAVNAVNTTHTLTITVAGVGSAIDPGTYTATASMPSGPGGFVGGSTCTYTATSPTCTVVISSTVNGTSVVHVTSTFNVSGQPITRATSTAVNTAAGGSVDASKTWVDANISITPASAQNTIGTTHTFTITVAGLNGTIDAGTYTATASIVSDTAASTFVGSPTCTYTAASPSCNVVITSAVVGTTTVHAATTVKVSGQTIARATNTALNTNAGGSGDATKTWVAPPPSGGGGGGGGSAAQTPAISITKNPKSQQISPGGTANFTIVVTNTGNVTLTNVNVTDQLSPDCAKTSAAIGALASMGPGAIVTYNCSLANVTASFTNVATATGTPPSGANVTATDSAPVTVSTPLTPPPVTHASISIVKDPKSQTLGPGGTAKFRITVSNTGDVTLSSVNVADPLSADCSRGLGTLAVGQSTSYTCTRKNVRSGFQNVATASGQPPAGSMVQATDHATIRVQAFTPGKHPRISITKNPKHQTVITSITTGKTPSGAKTTTVVYGRATFTIKVTNSGDVALHGIVVKDPASIGCNKGVGFLLPGHSYTYTCMSKTVAMNFTNVATAIGEIPGGNKVHSSDTAVIVVSVKTTSTSGAQFTG